MSDPRRILIVKLGAVGDCLHTLIAARVLRERFPEATLGWVVETKSLDIVQGHPLLDHVHVWNRKQTSADLKQGRLFHARDPVRRVVEEIRAVGYEVAIDFQNLLKSGYFTWKSGASRRIGFRRLREGNFLFTNIRVRPKPTEYHMVERYLSLLRPLGIEVAGRPPAEPIFIPEDKSRAVDEFFAAHLPAGKPVAAINPAASLTRKLWPVERYAAVADRLVDAFGIVPLLIWGPGEEKLVEGVQSRMKRQAFLAPPTTIKELACLLGKCRLYLGNDSGPMHLAAAMGCAVVGLFGPIDPARVLPWTEHYRVVEPDEPYSKRRAIAGLAVEPVYRAAAELLERM